MMGGSRKIKNEQKKTEVILQRIQNWYGRLPNLFIYDEKIRGKVWLV